MKPRPQILWHQGLFLQPQHLQLQDLAHQALLEPVYRFGLPFFWGVAELTVDEAALAEGVVALERGAFLFQDGSYAVLHANAVATPRQLADAWEKGADSVTVHVGLRRWNDFGANVSDEADSPAGNARFVASAQPEEVCDLHCGGAAAEVRRHSYSLQLFFEHELPLLGEFHLIPLARLDRSRHAARLGEDFVPPLLSITGSSRLQSMVRQVRDLLRVSGRELEGTVRLRRESTAPLSFREGVALLALQCVRRYEVLLGHLAQYEAAHPCRIYGVLCELIAELSTFCTTNSDPAAAEISRNHYDHLDIHSCFCAAHTAIGKMLHDIAAAPTQLIPLLRDGDIYLADLPQDLPKQNSRFFLSVHSQAEPALVLAALHGAVKVSTTNHLRVLSTRALPGIGLTHTPVAPHGLAQRPHTLYMEVDSTHEQWDMVLRDRTLALYWSDSPVDLEIELVVLSACEC